MLTKAKNSKEKIIKITMLGLLTALIMLFGLTPIGYIPTGLGFNITFLSVPVALGAVLMGPSAGAFLGLIFGLTSVYQGVTGMDPAGPALFASNAFGASVTCLVPRILMGLFVGLIAMLLIGLRKRLVAGEIATYAIIAACASFLNTLMFLGAFWAFFGGFTFASFISTVFALNAVLELVFAVVVTPPIAKAFFHVYSRITKKI